MSAGKNRNSTPRFPAVSFTDTTRVAAPRFEVSAEASSEAG